MFLTYGAQTLDLEVPGDARLLLPISSDAAAPEGELVRGALESPLGTAPLAALARGRRSAIILIACRTRRTGSAVFVPEIVRTLNAAGIPDDRILLCAANGQNRFSPLLLIHRSIRSPFPRHPSKRRD